MSENNTDSYTPDTERLYPYCPNSGKGFGGVDECPYCGTELIEP
jgi:hypothetical protein